MNPSSGRQITALTCVHCVASGKFLNLSVPSVSSWNGVDNCTDNMGFRRLESVRTMGALPVVPGRPDALEAFAAVTTAPCLPSVGHMCVCHQPKVT